MEDKLTLAIIGNGVVGGTLRRYLQTHTEHKIIISDPPRGDVCDLTLADAFFVSVPVPTKKSFKQDLTILRSVLAKLPKGRPVFLRSTVLPTTSDMLSNEYDLNIYHVPEFLTARQAYEDFLKSYVHVVGVPHRATEKTVARDLALLNKAVPNKKFNLVLNQEAELVKYMHNCLGALKVTFANVIYDIANQVDADYEIVRQYVTQVSPHISPQHLKVPGPDGQRGYGGTCFPVNVAAMIGFTFGTQAAGIFGLVHALNMNFRGTKEFEGIEDNKPEATL